MPDRLAGRLGVTPDEIFDEQWNIRGSLAELRLYSRVLTVDEIRKLAQ